MNKVDTSDVMVDAFNLKNSISVLSNFSYGLSLERITLADINELNAIIGAIQCLASKHADDVELLEDVLLSIK